MRALTLLLVLITASTCLGSAESQVDKRAETISGLVRIVGAQAGIVLSTLR